MEKYFFLSLFSDERRYEQFILNFLTNSIKFTPAGGEVTVLLNLLSITNIDEPEGEEEEEEEESKSGESDQQKNKVDDTDERFLTFQMIFRDTGCGISEENQKRLFNNFAKLEESKNKN